MCYLGFGRASAMGTEIESVSTSGSGLSIMEVYYRASALLENRDYFESSDGFIGFNLSKSVIQTMNPYPIEPTDTLFSGISNPITDQIFGAENVTYTNLFVSEYPLFEGSGELLYEDVVSRWTVAPIFQSRSPCLEGYAPIHITCMVSNKILGWVFATDSGSFCRSIHSTACDIEGQTDNRLSPFYPEPFDTSTPPSVGISGIISSSPPAYIVEAVRRRYVADGWPIDVDLSNYPTGMPNLWIQAVPNIVTKMDNMKASFNVFKYVSIFLMSLAGLLILIAFVLDLRTDLLVVRLIEQQREVLNEKATEALKREERRRQVESAYQLKLD
jgi:hypothetical protein